jgi:hypothetical protein
MYAYRLAAGKDKKDFLLKGISDKAGGRIYIGGGRKGCPNKQHLSHLENRYLLIVFAAGRNFRNVCVV